MGVDPRQSEGDARAGRLDNCREQQKRRRADHLPAEANKRDNGQTRAVHLQAPVPQNDQALHRNAVEMDLLRLDRRQVLLVHGLQRLKISAVEQLGGKVPAEELNGALDSLARRADHPRNGQVHQHPQGVQLEDRVSLRQGD